MSTYKMDPMHSEIMFKVKHMMITNTTGQFKTFDASMESSADDFTNAVISFEADVNSIDTRNEQRDGHLKGAEFFNAEQFPKISFASTSFTKINDESYQLKGNLTIRDITKETELQVTYGGTAVDFYGQTKSGFELTGKISRKEFGLLWNGITEAGNIVLADEIKLNLAVQMVKQA